jgi:hypothetical protein
LVKLSRSLQSWFHGHAAAPLVTALTETMIAILKAEGIGVTVEAVESLW